MFIEFARSDDPFRVQSGAAHVSDDIDPRVLFSSRWPGAFAELLTVPFSVGASEISGVVAYGRAYSSIPLVLGAVQVSGGGVFYPYAYTYGQAVGTQGNWSVVNDFVKLEATTVNVRFRLCSQDGAPYGGTLKIWVIG
jgi:hypothetical protein